MKTSTIPTTPRSTVNATTPTATPQRKAGVRFGTGDTVSITGRPFTERAKKAVAAAWQQFSLLIDKISISTGLKAETKITRAASSRTTGMATPTGVTSLATASNPETEGLLTRQVTAKSQPYIPTLKDKIARAIRSTATAISNTVGSAADNILSMVATGSSAAISTIRDFSVAAANVAVLGLSVAAGVFHAIATVVSLKRAYDAGNRMNAYENAALQARARGLNGKGPMGLSPGFFRDAVTMQKITAVKELGNGILSAVAATGAALGIASFGIGYIVSAVAIGIRAVWSKAVPWTAQLMGHGNLKEKFAMEIPAAIKSIKLALEDMYRGNMPALSPEQQLFLEVIHKIGWISSPTPSPLTAGRILSELEYIDTDHIKRAFGY
ncbi:hypothetical protein EBR96_05815 [bacterium]|nr:hypothetical protein [bacterium]